MSNIQAQIDALAVSIQVLDNTVSNVTGNTLSNYNQLSRIVAQQGNIYNTIYFGLGNLSTGNLNLTGNLFQNGSPYIASQWTTLNGNIYYNTGNVGIKNSTPQFELDVNGNINLSGNLYQNGLPYASSQWTTSESNIYYNVVNGNVGIGTTTPYYTLDVGGSANIASNVYCMNMFVINDCLVQGGDFSIMNGNLTVYKRFNTFGESVLNGNLTVYNADFYNYGNTYIYNGLYVNKNGALYTNNDVAGQHAFYSYDTVNLMSTLYGGADDTNKVGYFQARGYGGGLPLLLNPNGGNVGVGTGTPRATLSVSGNAVITGNVNINNGNIFMNRFGNLGIGTINPTVPLQVVGDANIGGNVIVLGGLTLPESFVQTYTPSVTLGTNLSIRSGFTPSGRYFTLGSLKAVFGTIYMQWANTSTLSGATSVTLPSTFFSNVYTFNITVSNVGTTAQQRVIGAGFTTNNFNFYAETAVGSASNNFDISFIVIGD